MEAEKLERPAAGRSSDSEVHHSAPTRARGKGGHVDGKRSSISKIDVDPGSNACTHIDEEKVAPILTFHDPSDREKSHFNHATLGAFLTRTSPTR
jgi:hypothetical protein